jgi:heptosyltransferase-2
MISLFGPTNPIEWAPLSKNSYYIKSPTGNIEDISVREIYQLSENLIEAR